MAFRKHKHNQQTGKLQTGTVLDVVESNEPVIRLKLEDGTLVRLKVSVLEVLKFDEVGPDGRPLFDINASLLASIVLKEEQIDG